MQDAFATSKRLGIRYLWINSLCIVQDDADDRKLESENLDNYYSNSALLMLAKMATPTRICWRYR